LPGQADFRAATTSVSNNHMVKLGKVLIAAVGAACVYRLRPTSFVPAPARHGPAAIAATAAVLGAAPSAFADRIDDAAAKLSTAAYPLLKEVNWNNDYLISLPGAKTGPVLKAIQKTLEMGAAMDGAAVKAGVKAHSEAIGAMDKDLVTTGNAFKKINSALGHMIASAGEAKTMAVYDAWKDVVPAEIPAYLKSTVNGKDAEAAYKALLDFKDVVKAEASATGAAAPAARTPDAIDTAAKTLSEAAYPLIKGVDWNADYYGKIPGAKPAAILQAVKKALDQGAAMDPKFIKEGALAHAKAIGDIDAKGVLPLDDFVAINTALGHMIKSSGTSATMDTYNAFKGLVADSIPAYLFSTVNPADAQAAYTALLSFKDVVKR